MREDFSAATIENLKVRAGNVCSFPGCHVPTSGPSEESKEKTSNTGVAAHICAASQGKGARRRLDLANFDKSLLSDYSNGIWLCEKHAKLIDTDEVRFTVEMLARWRELAELRARLNHETGRQVQMHLRDGYEVPLAAVEKTVEKANPDVINEVCNAVLDSCIVDVWGEDLGHSVRDLAAELLKNAFEHGGAQQFKLEIDFNKILIRSDDAPYSFGQLLADAKCNGGQMAAKSLLKLNDRLITSYRREGNWNVLEIAFITSAAQVLRTTCSVDYKDFFDTLSSEQLLPKTYSICETIYVVMEPDQHLIPSLAIRLVERLTELANHKNIVLIGTAISKDVVHRMKEMIPGLQVMQV